jgi:hypothetical protein
MMIDINSLLSDKKKTCTILSALILCALAFVLLFKYDFGNFRKIKLATAEDKYNRAILDSLAEHKKYLKEFDAYLAPVNGIDWLIGAITSAAKYNSVTLSAVKPLEAERSSGYNIVKASVEGTSSYENLFRLIESLEDSKEHVFIESISVKPIEAGAVGIVEIQLADSTENAPRGRSISFKAIIASVARET